MRFLRIFGFLLALSSFVFAQEFTRAEKLQKIQDLRSQVAAFEKDILQPDAADLTAAAKLGFSAIRLMPREKYEKILSIRGGGSYYSFVRKNQEYGYGSDIGLEQGNLKVGFAGADYGFIYDLGEVSLSEVNKNTNEAFFLVSYKPPVNEPEIRSEARKAFDYDYNGLKYRSHVPSAVGHTYLLRSISLGDSDVLVAFTVHRKDTDGSLIIFWKTIENFEKPLMVRSEVAEK